MKIFIRPLQGQEMELDVQSTDTVANVKTKIQENNGMEADLIRLRYNDQDLENRKILSDSNVVEGSILLLMQREYLIAIRREVNLNLFCFRQYWMYYLRKVYSREKKDVEFLPS